MSWKKQRRIILIISSVCCAWSCIKYKPKTALPRGPAVRSVNLGVKAVFSCFRRVKFWLNSVPTEIPGKWRAALFCFVSSRTYIGKTVGPCPGLALHTGSGKLDCLLWKGCDLRKQVFILAVKNKRSFLNLTWCLGWIKCLQDFMIRYKTGPALRSPDEKYLCFIWVNSKVWNNPCSQSLQTLGSGHLKVSFRTNAKEKSSCASFSNTVLLKVPLNWIKFFLINWHTISPCSTNGVVHQGYKLKPTVSITPTWGPSKCQGWTWEGFVRRWCPYQCFQGAFVLAKPSAH